MDQLNMADMRIPKILQTLWILIRINLSKILNPQNTKSMKDLSVNLSTSEHSPKYRNRKRLLGKDSKSTGSQTK